MNNIDSYNAELDASAAIFGGSGCTLFKNVPVGAEFVFWNDKDNVTEATILVRTQNGYRRRVGGRQWKTGQRVACLVIKFRGDL